MALPVLRKQHAQAFAGLVDWLKSDPALKRTVSTWRSWEGKDNDDAPWTADDKVGLRLKPMPGGSELVASNGTTRVWSRPLDVEIDGFISGASAADGLDLGDVLFRRLFPQDTPVLADLNARMATWGVLEILEIQPLDQASDSATQQIKLDGRVRLEMLMSG